MKKLFVVFFVVVVFGFIVVQVVEFFIVVVILVLYVEIFNVVKLLLVKEGVDLKIKEFIDYVQLNVQVLEKCLDVNFFQYQLYFDEFNKVKGIDLVVVIGVYIELLGVYLSKYKKFDELFFGVIVVIFNDVINGGCVLFLLDKVGVIKFKDNKSIIVMLKDIVDNLKNIKICELEVVILLCVLIQVDMVLININYVLEVKLNLIKDVLVIEGSDLFYVNIFVVWLDNKDSDVMQKLVKVLYSVEVKQFIQEKYKGVVVLVF